MRDASGNHRVGPGTWILLVVMAGLSGGLAGVVAVTLGGSGESSRSNPADEGLATAVRQLATQVAALQAVLAQQPQMIPEAPTAVANQHASTEAAPAPLVARPDIESVLQSLVAMLREQSSAGRGAPALVMPAPDAARREKVFKLQEQDNTTVTRAHLFWSEQQLLDAYGPPDSIEIHDDGDRWYYKPGAPGRYVSFLVHDGRVFQSWSQ